MKYHPLRCDYCNKIPRGKTRLAERAKYAPFCSYNCQQWAALRDARRFLAELEKRNGK